MYINRITGFNGNYNNSIQPQNQKQKLTDEQVANKLEEIIQGEVKKGEFLLSGIGAMEKAGRWLEDQDLHSNYSISTYRPNELLDLEKIFLNDNSFTIVDPVIKTFEAYDKYDNINRIICIHKRQEPYSDPEYEGEWELDDNCELLRKASPIDFADFGTRTVPVEYIELAYKDVEKLARLGFGDEKFLHWVMNPPKDYDSIPYWPDLNWKILPSGKIRSHYGDFRRFGDLGMLDDEKSQIDSINKNLSKVTDPKQIELLKKRKEIIDKKLEGRNKRVKYELEPGFVDKYLKAWKEEMLKVNRMGLDRYRYEKYGRTH